MAGDTDPVETTTNIDYDNGQSKFYKWEIVRKAEKTHSRVPGLRKIPLPAIGIILLVALVNILVWVAVGVVMVRFHCHVPFRMQANTPLMALLVYRLSSVIAEPRNMLGSN